MLEIHELTLKCYRVRRIPSEAGGQHSEDSGGPEAWLEKEAAGASDPRQLHAKDAQNTQVRQL